MTYHCHKNRGMLFSIGNGKACSHALPWLRKVRAGQPQTLGGKAHCWPLLGSMRDMWPEDVSVTEARLANASLAAELVSQECVTGHVSCRSLTTGGSPLQMHWLGRQDTITSWLAFRGRLNKTVVIYWLSVYLLPWLHCHSLPYKLEELFICNLDV